MAEANLFTQASVSQEVSYNPETGDFVWLRRGKGRSGVGTIAGCIHPTLGYRMIGMFNKRVYAHRLAWLITHGRWPDGQIDHINGDRADNRLCNLRECTHAENQANRHTARPNKHGLRGLDVCPKTGRYRARLVYKRKKYNLGVFDTAEEAHAAYLEAKRRINTFAYSG